METTDIHELFEKHNEEYLRFERVQEKYSQRPDLHALILLDKIIPGGRDIISGAENDECFISIDPEELIAAATEEQIIDLIRCGLLYSGDYEYLYFFA